MAIIPCNISIKEFALEHTSGPLAGIIEEYVAISVLSTDEAIWKDIEQGHKLEGTSDTLVITKTQYRNIFRPLFQKINESNKWERAKQVKLVKSASEPNVRFTPKCKFKTFANGPLGGYCTYMSYFDSYDGDLRWEYIGWDKTLKEVQLRIAMRCGSKNLNMDEI